MLLLWEKKHRLSLSLLIRPPGSYPKQVGWVLEPCTGYRPSCSELGWKQNSNVLNWSPVSLGLCPGYTEAVSLRPANTDCHLVCHGPVQRTHCPVESPQKWPQKSIDRSNFQTQASQLFPVHSIPHTNKAFASLAPMYNHPAIQINTPVCLSGPERTHRKWKVIFSDLTPSDSLVYFT